MPAFFARIYSFRLKGKKGENAFFRVKLSIFPRAESFQIFLQDMCFEILYKSYGLNKKFTRPHKNVARQCAFFP